MRRSIGSKPSAAWGTALLSSMKLQIKLILYNLAIKVAIIFVLSTVIVIFLDKISLNHSKLRILDKRQKLLKNMSAQEIRSLLEAEKTFTDYNILKEEYIILTRTAPVKLAGSHYDKFNIADREIEGQQGEYLILTSAFRYGHDYYRLEIGETMSALKQLKKTILLFSILALVISAVATLITDYAFTSYLLSPFYKIIEQKINKVNEPLSFSYDPIPTTTSDFRLLDDSINSLMTKITQQFVTQKQFISNVSHELLTPVSIIKTRLENLLSGESLSEAAESKILASLRTLNRLKSIVNSLLLISKVENNQYEKNDLIQIPQVIAEVAEDLEDRLMLKNIQLINDLKFNFTFSGNTALLHTLYTNIINNAIKYNREGGSIRISDQKKDGYYEVSVTDEGPGMSEELIEKAFNRFEKLNSSDKESNGLGLAIVKSIAAFHDITVSIRSDDHKGTTVTVSSPDLHLDSSTLV